LGAILRIQNNSYLTHQRLNGATFLSSGLETNVAIERSFKETLPKPYSNCDIPNPIASSSPIINSFSSDLYILIAHSPYQYTQQLCYEQCYLKYLINACNCTNPYALSLYTEYDACVSKEEKQCLYDYNNNENKHDLTVSCFSSCPLECNLTEYKTSSVSTSRLLNDFFLEHIKNNQQLLTDHNDVTDLNGIESNAALNGVSVNVYYDSLTYTISIEQPQMSVVSLLASIGGNLSLFLGLSVFSFLELAQLVCEMCVRRCLRKKNLI